MTLFHVYLFFPSCLSLVFIPRSLKCNSQSCRSLLSINPKMEDNKDQQSKCFKGNLSGWTHWLTAKMQLTLLICQIWIPTIPMHLLVNSKSFEQKQIKYMWIYEGQEIQNLYLGYNTHNLSLNRSKELYNGYTDQRIMYRRVQKGHESSERFSHGCCYHERVRRFRFPRVCRDADSGEGAERERR